MASTNHTPTLHLNQWVAGDPVIHGDFNEDNQKIDGAVEARALVRLSHGTLTASTAELNLDLSGLDLSQYLKLEVRLFPRCTNGNGSTLLMTANHLSTIDKMYATNGYSAQSSSGSRNIYLGRVDADDSRPFVVFLYLCQNYLRGCYLAPGSTNGNGYFMYDFPAIDFNSVYLTGSNLVNLQFFISSSDGNQLAAGTRYAVYGVKA